jgi:quercetin dioxygenase-like cupin family protein
MPVSGAHFIKNIDFSSVQTLVDLVAYQPGQVVSKTLAQNKAVSLTLFAFDKGEEISAHESSGDAMIVVLDGVAGITIGQEKFTVAHGQTIVMPARVPHAVFGMEKFKMLLTVVFPRRRRGRGNGKDRCLWNPARGMTPLDPTQRTGIAGCGSHPCRG